VSKAPLASANPGVIASFGYNFDGVGMPHSEQRALRVWDAGEEAWGDLKSRGIS